MAALHGPEEPLQCAAGVHGRVPDLARVVQRRYNLAMAVVLGNNMDGVIVETERVAKECIELLKQSRIPPLTFLPLDTLRLKPLNERLRSLGGTAKLAVDLLHVDPAFQRAFEFVCGCGRVFA